MKSGFCTTLKEENKLAWSIIDINRETHNMFTKNFDVQR